MSAEFTAALQNYIQERPQRRVSEIREVGRRAYRRHIEREGGPHFQWELEPNVARVLDCACLPDTVDDWDAVSRTIYSHPRIATLRTLSGVEMDEFTALQDRALSHLRMTDAALAPRRTYRRVRAWRRRVK
jgi:hypothetical protein